eukprot:2123133-Pleurochrysis_carterae.AAC.2
MADYMVTAPVSTPRNASQHMSSKHHAFACLKHLYASQRPGQRYRAHPHRWYKADGETNLLRCVHERRLC